MSKVVKFSKSRLMKQQQMGHLKYMTPLTPGTTLTIVDKIVNEFTDKNGTIVLNDALVCVDGVGAQIKVPMREFNKMNILDDGKAYSEEEGEDEVIMPAAIIIAGSTNRKFTPRTEGAEEQDLYPTFSYKDHKEFLAGDIDWETLVASGLAEDNKFKPVQNYDVNVKSHA